MTTVMVVITVTPTDRAQYQELARFLVPLGLTVLREVRRAVYSSVFTDVALLPVT